ncbi:hypothetical protein J3Q64DRAFT_1642306 [Phycomyces blakesleeanus]
MATSLQIPFTKDSPIAYSPGKLPLIITVPHGGLWEPSDIPDRTAKGSLLLADAFTKNIALDIADRITAHYNSRPHLIFQVRRRKVDVNRCEDQGVESDKGRLLWKEYHGTIEAAANNLLKEYPHGLLIDLHGHTHTHGMIELGYLLNTADIHEAKGLDERVLNQSSIQSLAQRHKSRIHPSDLLFGNHSFGEALQQAQIDSLGVVPSPKNPLPVSDALYFHGGYTVERHRSKNQRIGLDAIQIEMPQKARFSPTGRQALVESISQAVITMLDRYYLTRAKL